MWIGFNNSIFGRFDKKFARITNAGKALKNLCSSLRKIATRKLLTKPKAEKKQKSKSLRLKIF